MSGMMYPSGVTGMRFYAGTGPGAIGVTDWLAEVQGLVKQAGLVATKVVQRPFALQDPTGNPNVVRFAPIEVHLEPGTTPEQAQAAVDAVAMKMPPGQRVEWHYDVVPLGSFEEEAERARRAFEGDDG